MNINKTYIYIGLGILLVLFIIWGLSQTVQYYNLSKVGETTIKKLEKEVQAKDDTIKSLKKEIIKIRSNREKISIDSEIKELKELTEELHKLRSAPSKVTDDMTVEELRSYYLREFKK